MTEGSLNIPRVIVFASGNFALPLLGMLIEKKQLAGVVLPDPAEVPHLMAEVNQLAAQLHNANISYELCCKEKLPLIISELDRWQGSIGVIATYPHLLPKLVLDYFPFGVYNLHGSLLPMYAGPMPLYWQIRHQVSQTGIVLHRAEELADAGAIIAEKKFPLHPLDTLQSLGNQLAQHACELVVQLLNETLEQTRAPEGVKQVAHTFDGEEPECRYARRPVPQDGEIRCASMTGNQISALCRASANQYFSAHLYIKGVPINILQASEVDHPTYGTKAGTVMLVDEIEGFIVCVMGGCVRLDVLASVDGVFSGAVFAERFDIDAGTALG